MKKNHDFLMPTQSRFYRRKYFSAVIAGVVLTICSAAAAQARIGETADQVGARYGSAIAVGAGMDGDGAVRARFSKTDELGNAVRVYEHGGFVIAVTFENGRSAVELFVHRDGRAVTDAEFEAIAAPYTNDREMSVNRIADELQVGRIDYIARRVAKIRANDADRLRGF